MECELLHGLQYIIHQNHSYIRKIFFLVYHNESSSFFQSLGSKFVSVEIGTFQAKKHLTAFYAATVGRKSVARTEFIVKVGKLIHRHKYKGMQNVFGNLFVCVINIVLLMVIGLFDFMYLELYGILSFDELLDELIHVDLSEQIDDRVC